MDQANGYDKGFRDSVFEFQRICRMIQKKNPEKLVLAARSLIQLVKRLRQEQRERFDNERLRFQLIFDCMQVIAQWHVMRQLVGEAGESEELKRCSAELEDLFPLSKSKATFNKSLAEIFEKAGLSPSLSAFMEPDDVGRAEEQLGECDDAHIVKALLEDLVFLRLVQNQPRSLDEEAWRLFLERLKMVISLFGEYPERVLQSPLMPNDVLYNLSEFVTRNGYKPIEVDLGDYV